MVTPGYSDTPWQLVYELRGPLHQLLLPPPRPSAFARGLWQHTCFEWFVKPEQQTIYQEFNFSPSSEWASFSFARERAPDNAHGSLAEQAAPQLQLAQTADVLTLRVQVPSANLPAVNTPLVMGLCAVLEMQDTSLSYWAVQHPSPKPDFHHPGSFVPFN